MMIGTYVVKIDGIEVARQRNLITTAGKRVMAGYLAGIIPSWAGSIGLGVGDTTAVVGDTYLDFEIARIPVSSRSVAYGAGAGGAHRVIVKGELTEQISGVIWELGVFSELTDSIIQGGSSKLICAGDSSEDWEEYDGANWIDVASTPNTTSSRFGEDAITMTVGATSKKYRLTDLALDLSDNRPNDKIIIATRTISGTLSTSTIRLKTDDSNYYSYAPSAASFSTGTYAAREFNRSSWTATGTPSWSEINTVEIEISSGSSVELIFDGMRVQEFTPVDSDTVLFSRTVLGVPIIKPSGSRMEVEYYLDV